MQDKFEQNIKSQFENYEISPPPVAWEHISEAIKEEKPKAFIWTKKWVQIAAVFLIPAMIGLGILFINNDANNVDSHGTSNIANSPNKIIITPAQGDSTIYLDQQIKDNSSTPSNTSPAQSTIAVRKEKKSSHNRIQNFFSNLFGDVTQGTPTNEYNQQLTGTKNQISILNLLDIHTENIQPRLSPPNLYAYYTPSNSDLEITAFNATEEKIEKTKSSLDNKMIKGLSISPYAGVAMLGSFNQPSLIAPEFNDLEIDNQLSTSYGSNISFQINDRLKMRSGVGVLDLEQNTYNVPMKLQTDKSSISHNVKSFTNINVDFNETGYISDFSENAITGSENGLEQNLSHQIQFIEVPIEMEYAVIQGKKVNIAATGGMSTLFLNKNDVYLKDIHTVLAKSTNIKSVSLSANAGVKLDYEVTDKLSINIEPQLKYMINTVTANDDIQPYLLGVNAGISYSL